jgi:hypothetical protein
MEVTTVRPLWLRVPGSRRRPARPILGLMRHFRLWLLAIGVLSLAAEAVAAAAVFWRRPAAARDTDSTH